MGEGPAGARGSSAKRSMADLGRQVTCSTWCIVYRIFLQDRYTVSPQRRCGVDRSRSRKVDLREGRRLDHFSRSAAPMRGPQCLGPPQQTFREKKFNNLVNAFLQVQ